MRMRKLRGPHKKKSMPFENFRTRTQPVNLADLEERFEAGAEVTPETLQEKGLAKRTDPVKILARGEISKKLTVHAHAFSAAAKEKIEAAGGILSTSSGAVMLRRSSTPSAFRTSARSCCSRRRSWLSTGSAPTSRRPASTSTPSRTSRTTSAARNILGFLNLFSGGSLSRLSLFALGIMPYITASIILQLLTVVVPSLERLQKEGEVGQQKITQYTRYLTVGLAFGAVARLRLPLPILRRRSAAPASSAS